MSCQWITVAEAARRLSVKEKTIRRWYRSGRLKVFNPSPRIIRICVEELEKLSVREPLEIANVYED